MDSKCHSECWSQGRLGGMAWMNLHENTVPRTLLSKSLTVYAARYCGIVGGVMRQALGERAVEKSLAHRHEPDPDCPMPSDQYRRVLEPHIALVDPPVTHHQPRREIGGPDTVSPAERRSRMETGAPGAALARIPGGRVGGFSVSSGLFLPSTQHASLGGKCLY